MRAATIRDGAIVIEEHPDPEPGSGECLIRVRGAGINGADILQRAGHYPPPPGVSEEIPGMELAGEVVEIGAGVLRAEVGDRVMAIVAGAAQAELCVVHESQLMPVPEGLDWAAAGGLPEVFCTAYDSVFSQGSLAIGERLLVHGAAGGVGTAAVQLGTLAGCDVTATVRNEEMRDGVAELGATVIGPEDFEDAGPFDVILELVGGANMPGNLKALATGGRICVIGVGGSGPKAEVNLLALMGKRGSIHASTLRARPLEQKADVARLVERHVLPGFASGALQVPVAASYDLEQAAEAYERFTAGGKLGKVVITGGD